MIHKEDSMNSLAKIKVLIIDDSKQMREWLSQILSSDPDIVVVGQAPDPFSARDLIKKTHPSVLTLDIIMPHMDGLTFLRNLMRLHPLPVVVISSLAQQGSAIAKEAMAFGAIDYLPKPSINEMNPLDSDAKALIHRVKKAANSKADYLKFKSQAAAKTTVNPLIYQSSFLKNIVIVIGASTGGIEAIESILHYLPKIFPPILIAQHIRQDFSKAFANRINKLYRLNVAEANDRDPILPGNVYIAPGGKHLCITSFGKGQLCKLMDTDAVQGHKPSIDVLFESAAETFGVNTIAILLTGMGEDGAHGAKRIQEAGGTVIVQDKETSVVWGMPGAAVKLKAMDYILPLGEIPQALLNILDILAARTPTK
jgi:two-component system chemotaxis response regulator CheB